MADNYAAARRPRSAINHCSQPSSIAMSSDGHTLFVNETGRYRL
jgi:sugar lactone lactonase YvrE